VQRIKKRHQGRRLGRAKVFSVSRHVASALKDLANQLVTGETRRDSIQCRTTLAAFATQGVAIPALFSLKHDRALPFKCGSAREQFGWNRRTAPSIH
jgi:hypothetical protein